MGSSAVYVFLALTESVFPLLVVHIAVWLSTGVLTRARRLCYDMRLPHSIADDPGLARLWEAANIIISL